MLCVVQHTVFKVPTKHLVYNFFHEFAHITSQAYTFDKRQSSGILLLSSNFVNSSARGFATLSHCSMSTRFVMLSGPGAENLRKRPISSYIHIINTVYTRELFFRRRVNVILREDGGEIIVERISLVLWVHHEFVIYQ